MDFRLRAFVGPLSALRDGKRRIPSALVAALTDDLGLVPDLDAFRKDQHPRDDRNAGKDKSFRVSFQGCGLCLGELDSEALPSRIDTAENDHHKNRRSEAFDEP